LIADEEIMIGGTISASGWLGGNGSDGGVTGLSRGGDVEPPEAGRGGRGIPHFFWNFPDGAGGGAGAGGGILFIAPHITIEATGSVSTLGGGGRASNGGSIKLIADTIDEHTSSTLKAGRVYRSVAEGTIIFSVDSEGRGYRRSSDLAAISVE
jgi:hypothetical protein